MVGHEAGHAIKKDVLKYEGFKIKPWLPNKVINAYKKSNELHDDRHGARMSLYSWILLFDESGLFEQMDNGNLRNPFLPWITALGHFFLGMSWTPKCFKYPPPHIRFIESVAYAGVLMNKLATGSAPGGVFKRLRREGKDPMALFIEGIRMAENELNWFLSKHTSHSGPIDPKARLEKFEYSTKEGKYLRKMVAVPEILKKELG
ncbi:MAG: hypothetical protein HQL69_18940 [Magnetococcales bacterium]|nr:hypothetical protein [Magnetococcales bacterium]